MTAAELARADYAMLAQALYDELHSWDAVADACANGKRYYANTYRKIARRETKNPSKRVREGLVSAARIHVAGRITGLNLPGERAARGGIAIRRSLWLRLSELKIHQNWTWDELLEEALILLLKRYPDA